ncbi:response regulator transcription factor [Candidatus Peregrinibacteria bacterium]|jgi:CheY-like chemotaxis protein|nr:response regulator transcription factor [Candidatus Peregrinibacteria bacterium]MBT4147908.1 response regulator transcription factor [Candidatus Peregrinibacteria bacterium]MBT4456399.1 response regulator transcription factor [Candidatus Peregrinibacteria bacterium]
MNEKLKILVADDEPWMPELVGGAAEVFSASTGVETEIFNAYDGAHALNLALREQVNLVLSDVNMPGGSGPLLLKGLLNGPSSPNMAFLSGGDISPEDAFIIEMMMQDPRMLGLIKKTCSPEMLRTLMLAASVNQRILNASTYCDDGVFDQITTETVRACRDYGVAVGGRFN